MIKYAKAPATPGLSFIYDAFKLAKQAKASVGGGVRTTPAPPRAPTAPVPGKPLGGAAPNMPGGCTANIPASKM